MMLQSVFTAIDGGYDDADHLALYSGQGRLAEHQGLVEMHVIDERCWMKTVDLHDVIDLTARDVSCPLIGSLQLASRLGFGYGFDPG